MRRRWHGGQPERGLLAGIGVLAHQAIPTPPRRGGTALTADEVVERLKGVTWERQYEHEDGEPASPWDGIAGKFTPTAPFSIGRPRQVGAVAKALRDPTSEEGRQVRGR